MTGNIFVRVGGAAALALLLSGCGGGESVTDQYVKDKGFDDNQKAAFSVCYKMMSANRPVFATPGGNVVLKSVPLDLCGCQVPTITTLFKEGAYVGFGTFARYMAKQDKSRKPGYVKNILNTPMDSAQVQSKLEASLNSCIKDYQSTHQELASKMFEPVPPPAKKT
jgi:hypothetical protein